MPLVYRHLRDQILRIIGSGTLVDQDLVDLRERLGRDPTIEPGIDFLMDLRQVQKTELTTVMVRRLARSAPASSSARRVAIVAQQDVLFGLSRMYQSLSTAHFEIEVFRKLGDALDWLERSDEAAQIG